MFMYVSNVVHMHFYTTSEVYSVGGFKQDELGIDSSYLMWSDWIILKYNSLTYLTF